ncbi:MAG: SulP family inorganic anion transporter [Cyanobacteria bacterium TGS_CYA1]|nr:SulP family inorganic anion transporter [Cyanobacteria bacterium TGS_CYA1]
MTTVVALPVAMAFGVASGLGAAAGLYGAMSCGLLAGVFGGTRGQQSGPTGPIAVVIASLLAAHPDKLYLVFAATIMAGALQIVFGRLRWGDWIKLVPYPVISGFMTGIALIIIIIHINPFFGIPGSKQILSSLHSFAGIPNSYNSAALLISLCTVILIYGLKFLSKKIPASLVALIAATLACSLLKLDVPRIGEIPSQLPVLTLPPIAINEMSIVLSGAITIAVLGSIDSLLTSLIAEKMLNTKHNSNQELIGQGLGNILTGLLGGLAGAGSTTRTLANIDAGGRTAFSAIIYSCLVILVITTLGPYAAQIPLSALAAILIILGIGIVDWRMIRHLRRAPRSDVLVMIVVLVMTVFFDLISAVVVGTLLACFLHIKKLSEARLSQHGHVDNGVYVYSFHGPVIFAEVNTLNDAHENFSQADQVIFDFEKAAFIDQSCAYYLNDLIKQLKDAGKTVQTIRMSDSVRNELVSMHCDAILQSEIFEEDHSFDKVSALMLQLNARSI